MGFELGTVVGIFVGSDDGIKVGVNEGKLLGTFVGDDDGALLDGCDVGRVVGKFEGTDDGCDVGRVVGKFEGTDDG